MKPYRVELSPESRAHVVRVQDWWETNRRGAPTLFLDELAAAVQRLQASPGAGQRYEAVADEIRRILMPRTRYHVYYTVDDPASLVMIRAVWHSSRGRGPEL